MNNQELLEAVAPYLPHKVQLKCSAIFKPNSNEKALVSYSDATLTPDLLADMCSGIFNSIGTFKLILRPISDLTKPCLEGGKVPIVELAKMCDNGHNYSDSKIKLFGSDHIMVYTGKCDDVENVNFKFRDGILCAVKIGGCNVTAYTFQKILKWLYKHHFDIDGLIPRYAIDINTLTTHK